MVGLLPLDKPDGAPALAKLAEAQGLRAVAERVLAELTHQPIVGHDELVGALGNGYIVNWFRCAGQLRASRRCSSRCEQGQATAPP